MAPSDYSADAPSSALTPDFDPEAETQLQTVPGAHSVSEASAAAAATQPARGAAAESAISPAELMAFDEIRRMRIYLRVIIAFFGLLLVFMPFIGGDPTARWVFSGGLVFYTSVVAWFVIITRNPSKYTFKYLMPVCVAGVPSGYAGVYYWGIFSPAVVAIGMMLYFYSLVGNRAFAFVLYLSCAVAQAVLSVLIIGGVIADRGLIGAGTLGFTGQVLTQIAIQAVLFCIYLIARLSRRSLVDSILRLEAAVRAVAQRDAMLREARQEIHRALRIGGPGRYTEQTLGSFKLGVVLGRGAMGEVYEARHVATGEPAAVKLLHRHLLASPDNVERFLREAKAVATLRVPNVVEVLEVGDPSEEMPYIAMERLHGNDLGHHLRARGRLDADETAAIIREVARGLDAAADAGIVHRDIKPHNIFLADSDDGRQVWKILDFGLSKLSGHDGTLTRGQVLGTPAYMAPEQARGDRTDHRADIYSLAAISYRALTGHPPFSGDDLWAVLGDVVHKMPRRPGDLADVDPDLERVLAIGLAKLPGLRFDRAGELAAAFEDASRGALGGDLRARADEVLAAQYWGARI